MSNEPNVTMQPVTSSSISRIGHDPANQHLYVDFGKAEKPSVYRYDGVTADQHTALLGAPSVGQHFIGNIKGKFTHTKVSL